MYLRVITDVLLGHARDNVLESGTHDVVKAAGSRDTDGSQEGQEGFDMYFRWHCHIGIIMGITSFLN